ncbi:MAG: DNA-3-methyladenine glycosylase 2 family protein [Clostridia bacterium]|nr:DNA-3-methyladenine glycosylase 2 family protein [Clostridia bacterium]
MEKIREFNINTLPCVEISNIPRLSIFKTFDCGQCFRFDPVSIFGNKYEFGGVAKGRYVVFGQNDESSLIIYGATKDDYLNIWKSYLALDVDYDKINLKIIMACPSDDMQRAVSFGNGIRILRQDRWESVCSFIISQNNNIPRIKKIIDTLCAKYGKKLEFLENTYYDFPDADTLNTVSEDDIFALKTGFRAKYIKDAAYKISSGEIDLKKIYDEADFEKCVDELCKIKGIGLKVASCALLFGFEKTQAFPIDVWMKRALSKYFPDGIDLDALGATAGIAQQYLFYYEKYVQNP